MSDFLQGLAQNQATRTLIKTLGLPLPPTLHRPRVPRDDRELSGKTVKGHIGSGGVAWERARDILQEAGATVNDSASTADILLFDATGFSALAHLDELYEFFHPELSALRPNGRVIVMTRPRHGLEPQAAATAAAVEGFVRSVGKEVGNRGATANLLVVQPGAETRLAGPLRFLASERASFVSGQPLHISKTVKGTLPHAWRRPLKDKVALVTGAARGIGETTAQVLAGEGAHVVCLDRPEDGAALQQVADRLGGTALTVDVTADTAPRQIAEALRQEHGGVDIVVHNAGVTRDKTLRKMRRDYWDTVLAVNLRAIVAIDEALTPETLREGGRIVCLSSIAGIGGNMGLTNYAATKAGVIGYVEAMAHVLAKRGITINGVAPGFIETRLTAAVPLVVREVGRRMNALVQGGEPSDVAEAITFLATPDALGLTGNILRVCGLNLMGA